jgi:lipopolysaccharide transport system ATP-binding protein
MGFHPDFTGRENVFMAGQLLGHGIEDIERLMPEVEAFAEIGDYINQPVRVYSSGMQMRLAFSVATAHRPDVLIVDEALSVGDAYFQHKSFDRIREFRNRGTTLLLVSHDKVAIQSICDRAILLNGGKLALEGEPEAVMDYYNALLADHQNKTVIQEARDDGRLQTISGSGEVTLVDVALLDAKGQRLEIVAVGQSVSLCVTATCNDKVQDLVVGYMIKDRLGQPIFGTNTYHHKRNLVNLHSNEIIEFNFDFQANLGPGSYSVAIALHAGDTHVAKNYEWRDRALIFNMLNIDKDEFVGVAWIPPVVRCSL